MTIRLATLKDAPRIAQIHVQSWQESYQGVLDPDYLRALSYDQRLTLRHSILESKSTACYVAEVNNEIVGFCDVGMASDGSGELYALYVLETYKRQHIGQGLWGMASTYFVAHDLEPFHTWVLKNNHPARRFYEKQGGVLTKELPVLIGEKMYDEVCYKFVGNKE